MARHEFSKATINRLAARVNYHCSNITCAASTTGPAYGGEDSLSVGVGCHITAAAPGGPRYDPSLTEEQRRSYSNGIYLCAVCSRKIDGDEETYPAKLLYYWKQMAEKIVAQNLGVPTAVPHSTLARISPSRRFGSDNYVVVDGSRVRSTNCFDSNAQDGSVTWFPDGYAIRFKMRRRDGNREFALDEIEATVHSYSPVPEFTPAYLAYPVETSLYLIELDRTVENEARQFTATRYFEHVPARGDDWRYSVERVAGPMVVNDDRPLSIVVRFNAITPGLYNVSLGIHLSDDKVSERIQVMEPRDILFLPSYDEE